MSHSYRSLFSSLPAIPGRPLRTALVLAACVGLLVGPQAQAIDIILNEYNAVRADRWLDRDGLSASNATDSYFGRIVGNGGRWFEMLITGQTSTAGETVDMRGWKFGWTETSLGSGTIELSNAAALENIHRGTLITFFSQDAEGPAVGSNLTGFGTSTAAGGNLPAYDPFSGSWWLNINVADSTLVSSGTLNTGNDDWQVTVSDAQDNVLFGPAGEGVGTLSGVSSREVGKLEVYPLGDPDNTIAGWQAITPLNTAYTDGTSSSFGAANMWSGGPISQNFDVLRVLQAPTGADLTWNLASGGDWDTTTGNWLDGASTVAFTNDDNVTFSNAAGGTIAVAGGGVDPASTTVSAATGTYTFSGGAIGGAGSFTKSGDGTVVLSAANSYAGGTVISGGVLEAASDAALGDAAGPITLDGGTLRAGGTITGSRTVAVAAGGGTLDTNGNATTVGSVSGAGNFAKVGSGTLTVSGGMPGASGGGVSVAAGTLQFTSTGSIDLNVASSGTGFAGDIVLQNAGRLRVTNSGTLGGGGTIRAETTGATLTVTGDGLTVDYANDIVLGSGVDIAIGSTGGNTVTFSGDISGGNGIRFTNSYGGGGGAGTTVISGANTYGGETRFHNTDSGIVQLAGGNNRLPTGTTLVFGGTPTRGGSTLDLNGVNQTVAGITNDVRENVGTITNTSATRSVLTVDGSTTPTNSFSGVIAGNIDLVKQGSGTLALTGANTFTGDTDVFAGTLLVDGSLAGGVLVASAGTIGGNGTVGGSLALAGNGSKFVFDPLQTLTVNGSSVSFLGSFGIGDLIGLDASTPLGLYTLIDGDATVLTQNLLNLGAGNPFDLGGGKTAYFQSGSLQVQVVPEPSTVALAAAALGLAAIAARRRLKKA